MHNKTLSIIERFKKIHGNKYDYSKSLYVKSCEKICITCLIHGDFFMTPHNHLKGQGCPKCANLKKGLYRRNNTANFIERSKIKHSNKYDYSKVEYINNYTKVCIICPEHGEFYQKPNDHLKGIGCSICGQKYNKTELKLLNILKEKYTNVIYQYKDLFLVNQSIDFFLPDYNIGIEYNGRQHFMSIKKFGGDKGYIKTYERDLKKYRKCLENNIKLFYLTLEKCDTNNYFTKVYNNINDLLNNIDFIKNAQKIN